jgi:aerobic-type carbon monoxide dehydrogenase small subunit (CoxS/CutS family)
MSAPETITLHVNGAEHVLHVDASTPLIYVLRNQLALTAAKLGCALEQCGACAVLVDGVSTLSCVTPVAAFAGRAIVTCEGLGGAAALSAVQQAFVDEGAGQCGYCIPGLVVAVTALLHAHPDPDEAQIRTALTPHLCRCGAHPRVLRAVRRAAAMAP